MLAGEGASYHQREVLQQPQGRLTDGAGPDERRNKLSAKLGCEDTGLIPPRGWLLATQFCRKFVSSLVGPGAIGKAALRLLQYFSLVVGRAFTGQHVFRRSRVLLLSFEDDRDELRRRIKAVLIRYQIPH